MEKIKEHAWIYFVIRISQLEFFEASYQILVKSFVVYIQPNGTQRAYTVSL